MTRGDRFLAKAATPLVAIQCGVAFVLHPHGMQLVAIVMVNTLIGAVVGLRAIVLDESEQR